MKNAKPSSVNGNPMMPPENSIHRGHSSPSSNERIVPETAPTANSTAATRAQRLAPGHQPVRLVAGPQPDALGNHQKQWDPDPAS